MEFTALFKWLSKLWSYLIECTQCFQITEIFCYHYQYHFVLKIAYKLTKSLMSKCYILTLSSYFHYFEFGPLTHLFIDIFNILMSQSLLWLIFFLLCMFSQKRKSLLPFSVQSFSLLKCNIFQSKLKHHYIISYLENVLILNIVSFLQKPGIIMK